jgi:GMP synthase (glutamine-hydrolysing)
VKVLAVIYHSVAGAGLVPDVVCERGHELEFWTPSEQALPRRLEEYGAVFAFGGGMQADEDELHPWLSSALDALRACLDGGIPTLGICLGGQLLARAAGGWVGPAPQPETGWRAVDLTDDAVGDPLFGGLPSRFDVYQWHSYAFEVPADGVLLARNEIAHQCFRVGDCAWGLQWHPEALGESILYWAEHHRPAPDGVPVEVDLDALRAEVATRIGESNDDGRQLFGRFLAVAESRAAVSGADPRA